MTQTTFTTPTADVWVRDTGKSVTITSTGTISFSDGTNDIADIGTFRLTHQFTPDGLTITQKLSFNSGGGGNVRMAVSGGYYGGYPAMWSLDSGFREYQFLPYHSRGQRITAAYNDGFETPVASGLMMMHDRSRKVTAYYTCAFSYYDASGKIALCNPKSTVQRRYSVSPDVYKFNKLLTFFDYGTADIILGDGDEIIATQNRMFVPLSSGSSDGGLLGPKLLN
jgi:hypothetical protein